MEYAVVNEDTCTRCRLCGTVCPTNAMDTASFGAPGIARPDACLACGHCYAACPSDAIACSDPDQHFTTEIYKGGVAPDTMLSMLASRRSCRHFKDEPVPKDVLDRLLLAGALAPSAKNSQIREFVVVTETATLKRMVAALLPKLKSTTRTLRTISGAFGALMFPKEAREYFRKMRVGFLETIGRLERGEDAIFNGAPLVIFINAYRRDPVARDNCIASQHYILSQAQSEGLAGCIMGYVQSAASIADKELGVPNGFTTYAVVALGYPRYEYERVPPRRKPQVRYIGDQGSQS